MDMTPAGSIVHISEELKRIDKNIKNMHKRFDQYAKGNYSVDVEIKYPHIDKGE